MKKRSHGKENAKTFSTSLLQFPEIGKKMSMRKFCRVSLEREIIKQKETRYQSKSRARTRLNSSYQFALLW